jgi:hypothetical protein
LAVIGPRWLNAVDEAGNRRLDNPDDFVRIEIESSLKQGKRIIPVLVNGAEMPRAEYLPEALKLLARRNAVRLTHERFKADAERLVRALEKALDDAGPSRQPDPTTPSKPGTQQTASSSLPSILIIGFMLLMLAFAGWALYNSSSGPTTTPGASGKSDRITDPNDPRNQKGDLLPGPPQ